MAIRGCLAEVHLTVALGQQGGQGSLGLLGCAMRPEMERDNVGENYGVDPSDDKRYESSKEEVL